MSGAFNRVVVLVDMDCFYVQVEQRRDPSRKGKPCAVVQYKTYQGGGIIAVGYEARAKGVTRGMWGDEAKELCPDIHLFRVPEAHGKANLDRYREAGAEVINVLSQFGGRVERASIDEAYIELTDVINRIIEQNVQSEYIATDRLPNTHVVGWTEAEEIADKSEARSNGLKAWLDKIQPEQQNAGNRKLTIAAAIVEDIREAVFHQTGFRCSAGISHNKMLSKLACGINKPNKQTILPCASIESLFSSLKIRKIRNLGGKLGKSLVENFGIEFIGQVGSVALEKLVSSYGQKSALWLHEVCKGIDHEPVKERHIAQSIGCGKNFLGPEALNTKKKVTEWMRALIVEISERLEKDRSANSRVARTLTVHTRLETKQSLSRSGPLLSYDKDSLLQQCLGLIRALDTRSSQDLRWSPAIISMSINAKKFDIVGGSISSMLQKTSPLKPLNSGQDSSNTQQTKKSSNLSSIFFGNGAKKTRGTENDSANHEPEKISATPEKVHSKPKHFCEVLATSTSPLPKVTTETSTASNSNITVGTEKVQAESSQIETSTVDNSNVTAGIENPQAESSKMAQTSSQNPKTSGPSEGPTPCSSESQDDVVFVSRQKLTAPKKNIRSFFDSVKEPQVDTNAPCMIDQVFLKEREKADEACLASSIPGGTFSHPLFGEIDVSVFETLPSDIKQEILRSHKITSSVLPPSQPKKHPTQNLKKTDKNQRLIFNFIPTTRAVSSTSKNYSNLGEVRTGMNGKRQHSDTSPESSKKSKMAPKRKSPKQKKANASTFSSCTKDDVVPLGFFRQRSQLNSAICKALTKQPSKTWQKK